MVRICFIMTHLKRFNKTVSDCKYSTYWFWHDSCSVVCSMETYKMKRENKYYLKIRRFTVIIFLVIISSPKIYSQAQEQGLPTEGKTNLCTPHTNKTVDSPSTLAWANLSAPTIQHFTMLNWSARNFTSVKHEEIYSSVDAVVLIKDSSLSSEFIINPGAEMHHIMLTYNRARNIKINNSKELVHDGEFRRFVMKEPVAYQMIEGRQYSD